MWALIPRRHKHAAIASDLTPGMLLRVCFVFPIISCQIFHHDNSYFSSDGDICFPDGSVTDSWHRLAVAYFWEADIISLTRTASQRAAYRAQRRAKRRETLLLTVWAASQQTEMNIKKRLFYCCCCCCWFCFGVSCRAMWNPLTRTVALGRCCPAAADCWWQQTWRRQAGSLHR